MKIAVAVLVLAVLQVVVGQRDYETSSLKIHNEKRALHQNTPKMVLDSKLNQIATTCAKYYLAGNEVHTCPDKKDAGENIYQMPAKQPAVEAVTQAAALFYKERKNYDYANPGSKSKGMIGHFTQMVWVASKQLGVGYATAGKKTVVVNLYKAAGNMRGQYDKNVKPPK